MKQQNKDLNSSQDRTNYSVDGLEHEMRSDNAFVGKT